MLISNLKFWEFLWWSSELRLMDIFQIFEFIKKSRLLRNIVDITYYSIYVTLGLLLLLLSLWLFLWIYLDFYRYFLNNIFQSFISDWNCLSIITLVENLIILIYFFIRIIILVSLLISISPNSSVVFYFQFKSNRFSNLKYPVYIISINCFLSFEMGVGVNNAFPQWISNYIWLWAHYTLISNSRLNRWFWISISCSHHAFHLLTVF